MRWPAALAALATACAGASAEVEQPSPEPTRSVCPECPDRECPACPACPAVACPACPVCQLPPPDARGWYCMDDPKTKDMKHAYSYCWTEREHCELIHEVFVKRRRTIKPCRPHTPVYCFHARSEVVQVWRYYCSATLEHCENRRDAEQNNVKPVDGYTFSSCTEHP